MLLGFFYRTECNKYLITAAHNALPTDIHIRDEVRGALLAEYTTDNYLPIIAIFLETEDGWVTKIVDICDPDVKVIRPKGVDILAVEIDFDPGKYGYRVWTIGDLGNAELDEEELRIVGYDGGAFPDSDEEFSFELYEREIGKPVEVTFENPPVDGMAGTPLFCVGVDTGSKTDYTGMSGSPIIGDRLVGIFVSEDMSPASAREMMEWPETTRRIGYFRSKIIPQMTSG